MCRAGLQFWYQNVGSDRQISYIIVWMKTVTSICVLKRPLAHFLCYNKYHQFTLIYFFRLTLWKKK